jgi:hypothetical protein
MCSADGSTNVTRFHPVVNLKIAKAIGLTIPEAFVQRADELIDWGVSQRRNVGPPMAARRQKR